MYRKIGLLRLFYTQVYIHSQTPRTNTFCTNSIILFSKNYIIIESICDVIEKNISRLRRPDSEIVNLWLTHVGEMEIKMQILFLELQRLSKNGIPSIVVRYHNENFFSFFAYRARKSNADKNL